MAYGESTEPTEIPKDAADAKALADELMGVWAERDTRMDEEDREYALVRPALKPYEERIAVNDVALLEDKLAEELSRVDLHIQVAPGTAEDRSAAQHIEDAAYWWLREAESRHATGLHAPLRYEAAHYLVHRGWVCAELLANPDDPGFPWALRLLDPRNVYPDRDSGTPGVVVYRYEASETELLGYWGKKRFNAARKDHSPTPDTGGTTRMYTCYTFYTDTHLGVLLDGGGWLKKPYPHLYGRSPLIIALAPGSPVRATPSTDGSQIKLVGPSILRATIDVIRDKARIAARVMRMLTKTAAPPHFFATSDPEATAEDVDVEPNSITIGRQGDALTPVVPPPVAFQYAQSLLALEQDQLNRGFVSPNLFGEGAPGSGYDRIKQLGTSLSKLDLYLQTLAAWYETLLRLMLRQFAFFGPPDLTYISRDRTTGLRTAANRLTPWEVLGADTRLEVRPGNMIDVDLMQMGQLSAQLVERGIVSAEFALTEFLKVDNPTAVMLQARSEQFYKNPQYLQLATCWDKAHDAMDPMGQELARFMFPLMWQQFQMQAMQPPGGPPGPPGAPPGAPPLPGSGVPSPALPDAMNGGAGLPPGMGGMGPPQVGAGMPSIVPPGMMPPF